MEIATPDKSDQLVVSVKCYVKLLLHCMKYPHATVNGLILAGDVSGKNITSSGKKSGKSNSGKTGQQTSSTSSPDEATKWGLVDVVPLFHLGHGLTPMLELALLQVSAYCRENNLKIAGVYQANRFFHDHSPDIFIQRIAEKIGENNVDSSLIVPSLLVMVNSHQLAKAIEGEESIESVLQVFSLSEGKWKSKNNLVSYESSSSTSDIVNELVLNEKLQLKLKDFDCHLDDLSNDWTNSLLNGEIASYVGSSVSSE